jgi:hypothetical protein
VRVHKPSSVELGPLKTPKNQEGNLSASSFYLRPFCLFPAQTNNSLPPSWPPPSALLFFRFASCHPYHPIHPFRVSHPTTQTTTERQEDREQLARRTRKHRRARIYENSLIYPKSSLPFLCRVPERLRACAQQRPWTHQGTVPLRPRLAIPATL